MKNLFKVSALVLGLGLGYNTQAAIVVDHDDNGALGTLVNGDNFFDIVISTQGSFSNTFSLILPTNSELISGEYLLSWGNKKNTTKTSGIDSASFNFDLKDNSNNPLTFDNDGYAAVSAGTYLLTISGKTGNTAFGNFGSGLFNQAPIADGDAVGKYGWVGANLNVTVSEQAPPVPEPEEWAMMLLGLPLMGFVSARRRKA